VLKFLVPYLIHIAVVLGFIHWLSPVVKTDLFLYIYSVGAALLLVFVSRRKIKDKIFQFFAAQSLSIWLCYIYLSPEYYVVTNYLLGLRQVLIYGLVVIELAALYCLIKNFNMNKDINVSAENAFRKTLNDMGTPPELIKIFVIELIIWLSLYRHIRSKQPNVSFYFAKLDTGYSGAILLIVFFVILSSFLSVIFFTSGILRIILAIVVIYVACLAHADYFTFKKREIEIKDDLLIIPNGVLGEIEIKINNVDSFEYLNNSHSRLNVYRLKQPNSLLRLKKPIDYYGELVDQISLAVESGAISLEGLR